MKMLKTIIPLLLFIGLVSCKKENKSQTISGTIVIDCNGTPLANQSLELDALGNITFNRGGVTIPFTTDSKGNFSVTNTNPVIGEEVFIQYPNGGKRLLEYRTSEEDINIGTFNSTPTANYQLKITINNTTLTNTDTLLIGDQSGLRRYKIGYPFLDTTYPVVFDYTNPIAIKTLENKNIVKYGAYYNIYSGKLNTPSCIEKKTVGIGEDFESCKSTINQVEIVVD